MRKLLPALAFLSACSTPPAGPTAGGSADARPHDAPAFRFQAPAGWVQEEPANRLRKAQYRVPDKDKQAKDAEMAVFHMRNAGSVENNLRQWVSQMGGAEPRREDLEGKCRFTLVDLHGTYNSPSGDDSVEHARMLAAYVDTSDGPWIFKLVGPLDTVSDWREEFVALLKAAKE